MHNIVTIKTLLAHKFLIIMTIKLFSGYQIYLVVLIYLEIRLETEARTILLLTIVHLISQRMQRSLIYTTSLFDVAILSCCCSNFTFTTLQLFRYMIA